MQSHAKLAAEGYAKLRSGEMPSDAQLYAMGLNEPETRGMIVLFQMEKMDDAADGYRMTKSADQSFRTNLDTVKTLDDFLTTPQKLTGSTGYELHNYLLNNGYDVQPLSKGSFKGIPFEEGGGFKVNWGGDRILQYHPSKSSHHGGAYFKISSGETGTIRIDMDGNVIK